MEFEENGGAAEVSPRKTEIYDKCTVLAELPSIRTLASRICTRCVRILKNPASSVLDTPPGLCQDCEGLACSSDMTLLVVRSNGMRAKVGIYKKYTDAYAPFIYSENILWSVCRVVVM